MENRKKAVSIRVGSNDLRNVKRLAKRLGVRDSDVIRAAVKLLLAKFAPLYDPTVRGRNLVPVFVESGNDLFRHFDLDAPRLDSIVNDGVSEDGRVDAEDIQLLAMSGLQRSYLKLRLEHLGSSHHVAAMESARGRTAEDPDVDQTLRQYLYDKYVYSGVAASRLASTPEVK